MKRLKLYQHQNQGQKYKNHHILSLFTFFHVVIESSMRTGGWMGYGEDNVARSTEVLVIIGRV